MTKEKELKLVKTFHITPETAKAFEDLRRSFYHETGLRVGSSGFFEYLIREAVKREEAEKQIHN